MATTTTKIIFVSILDGTNQLVFTNKSGNCGKDITTDVKPGDKVKWKICSTGLVITGIPMKTPDGEKIWSKAPALTKNNKNWQGTVLQSCGPCTEGYSVQYTINGGKPLEQDPDIKVQGDDTGN